MRIVQLITRPQRRGAEIFALQLSEYLMALGHEVWVISLFKGDGVLDFSGNFKRLDLPESSKWDFKGFKKLAKQLDSIDPEIVQANASDTLRYSVCAKYLTRKRFVLVYRNANTISAFIKSNLQRLYNHMLHAQVDAVVSVSDHSRRDYLSLFNPKVIKTIPIGIDPVEIDRKLGDVKECEDYLLFIGSLVEEKDPLGMLEIFRKIQEVHPHLQLKFLGSGPLRASLLEKIEKLGLQGSVELIENQSNIFPVLGAARELVMPSKIEGLPGVILEAMYCKVPVIAFDVGGISEVIKHQETGWCVEAGDSKKFESSVLEVLGTSKSDSSQTTNSAKNLVEDKYRIEQVAKEFEAFYQNIISKA